MTKAKITDLTAERLLEVFDYDHERGVLIRRGGRFKGAICGQEAGAKKHLRIRVDGEFYALHRLIWLHAHGVWPTEVIDHIDGNRGNNRLSNLRDVDQATNMQNQRKAMSSSKTGLLGAYPWRDKFAAGIGINGRIKHLGVFNTAEEAHAKYLDAKRAMHAGCTI
jgi:hypothetical protein